MFKKLNLLGRSIGVIVAINLWASGPVAEPTLERNGPPWPDTRLARVEVLALIETLNGRLLCASCTVTRVLEKWCADHKLARDPLVQARRVMGISKPVSPKQRQS